MPGSDEDFFLKLDELGEQEVRIRLNNHAYGKRHEALVREWLRQREESRNATSQAEQLEIARSAKDAAWAAARAARTANTRATIALIIATVSAIAAIIQILSK